MRANRRNACVSIGAVVAWGMCLWSTALADEIKGLPDPKAPCAGELPKDHPEAPWDFTTNSQKPKDGLTFLHCVHNNKSDVVDIRWLIPQLDEPVPAMESVLSPRYSEKAPLGIADGCLVYGNLLDKELKAQFWAREEDQSALDREKKLGSCSIALKTASGGPGKTTGERVGLREVVAPFRIFLAANLDYPAKTLMAFEGVTGVRPRSRSSYESFLQYRVRRPEGSQADELKGYTIAPRWVGDAESLAKFYNATSNQTVVAVRSSFEPREIHFSVEGSGAWRFGELEYEVRNDRGAVAGRVYAPTFIPQ